MSTEYERLEAVHRLRQFDAGIRQDLNELINLVAQLCNMPIALVSLIDDKMQWFQASVGTGDIDCNERDMSFCNRTIQHNELLIVPDATLDERFRDLPVVTGPPYIRFYAGVSLITFDGHAVGTLCVLDVKPNQITPIQQNMLRTMAKQALNLIELNWSLQSLIKQHEHTERQKKIIEDSEIKLKAVFDSSRDIHILLGKKMEVLAFNRVAEQYVKTNFNKQLISGMFLVEFTDPDILNQTVAAYQSAVRGEAITAEWLIKSGTVTACWLDFTLTPVIDNNNEIIGVALNAVDITLRKLDEEHINQQNAALQRIATIQSHELRRPVASLMGLIELTKIDGNYLQNSYYPMFEATVVELDTKIRDIINESEQILSYQVSSSS